MNRKLVYILLILIIIILTANWYILNYDPNPDNIKLLAKGNMTALIGFSSFLLYKYWKNYQFDEKLKKLSESEQNALNASNDIKNGDYDIQEEDE